LPALPESHPASPVLEAIPPAATRLLAGLEPEHLPSLPESRPDSPYLAPLSPVDTSPPVEGLETLPAFPESRPRSPALGTSCPCTPGF
jgi:hypothetical protein